MRTIKFRGRNIHNGEWVYGSLFQGISPTVIHPYSVIITDEKYDAEGHLPKDVALAFLKDEVFIVDSSTVGQFTGLFDKNGKEIYEGDIVQSKLKRARKYDERLVVCFGKFEWKVKNANGSTTSLSLIAEYHTTEIIGNMHDNPELLKGGEQ